MEKKTELRKFGYLVGGIFLAIAAYGFWKHHEIKSLLIGLGAALVALGAVAPMTLHYPHELWLKIGHVLGYINARLILSIVFFLVITPIALLRKIGGKKEDPTLGPDTFAMPAPVRNENQFKVQF